MRGMIAAALLLAALPAEAQQIDITSTTQADGTRTLAHEVTIPAPIAEVWEAVATVEGWRTWAVPLARVVAGSPDRFETGYASGAAAAIEQQWIERTAPGRASFRTTRVPEGFPHGDAYTRVISHFVLTPLGVGVTRVRLEGTGYPAGSAGDELLAFFREGNRISLRQLHARFATGPIDWAVRRPEQ